MLTSKTIWNATDFTLTIASISSLDRLVDEYMYIQKKYWPTATPMQLVIFYTSDVDRMLLVRVRFQFFNLKTIPFAYLLILRYIYYSNKKH